MTTAFPPSAIGNPQSAISKLSLFAADIKISHTIFALPWALLATVLAAKETHHPLTLTLILLILACMITARTVAMAANRLLDAHLDAINPRTARRALPSGVLTHRFYFTTLLACAFTFCLLTFAFYLLFNNPWPPVLALPVLAFLCAYPYLKRVTRLCHYYLGVALALAPVCAWLAVAARVDLAPLLMAAAVLCWTAGFDILYATQDYDSDRATGVFSVPSKLGIPRALWVARLTHLIAAAFLLTLGHISPTLSTFYFIGAALAILLLTVEHSLVKPHDLSRLNLAFFTLNGIISLLVCTLGLIDIVRAP